jgi:hypothetical protein
LAPSIKDKTKSRMGREIEIALTALNDQLSFSLFLEHEFLEKIKGFGSALAKQFTTDVFSQNPNASRIHVRLGELPSFINAHRSVSFGAYFTASYEVAIQLFDEALSVLLRTNVPSTGLPRSKKEGPEEYYERVLKRWGYSSPGEELIKTISWIRYRRNGLVHVSHSVNPRYATLATQSGQSLNHFWKAAKVHLDFSTTVTGPLNQQDALDLITLLRILVRRIDSHFVSLVSTGGLAHAEAKRLFGHQKVRMNQEVALRRSKVLRFEILRGFGLKLPVDDLMTAAQAFGKKPDFTLS